MFGMPDNDDLDVFSDQEIIAKTLYGEARNQGYQGQQAVCNVIFNRTAKPSWWGANPRQVCLHPYQFSCWNESDPNRSVIVEVTDKDQIYAQCLAIAADGLSGVLPDITGGATSYFVTSMSNPPAWAKGLDPSAIIGVHSFYIVCPVF